MSATYCTDTGQEGGHPCPGHVISVPPYHLMKAHGVPRSDNPLLYPTIIYSWCLLCIRPGLGPGDVENKPCPCPGEARIVISLSKRSEGRAWQRQGHQDVAP